MVAVITALFFAGAAAFAVFTISRAFEGSAERLDVLFAQYRAMNDPRTVTGGMQPVKRFMPAPAPDFAPRTVVALPVKGTGLTTNAGLSRMDWRAAA